MDTNNKTGLKKPEQIYQEELKSDLKDLMVGLTNEEKLKLAIEMMTQLGVNIPISIPEPVVEEITTTTTTEPEPPKDDSWFSSFEGLFIDNINTKPKEESKEITSKITEIIQKTPEITPTIEQKPTHPPSQLIKEGQDPIIKTEKPVAFKYEKPEGWNKKSEKVNFFKIVWDGIRDVGMGPKEQKRYDDFKGNFFIVAIISLLIYIVIAFNTYKSNSGYDTNKSYMDRFINYCAEKYDKITGRDKITYTVKDTIKPVIIDTPKLLIKIDTPVVITPVVPVVEAPKPMFKDTPVKKPVVSSVNKNKKENLVEYIRTLPEYSKFGPMDLPYLTQDVNKVDWTFLRADGKTVHFHYNSLEGTYSVSQ
jgi:hypothetical protein